MIELLKEYSFLAPFATAISVVIAMVQLWRSASQGKTTFEDTISKEYRDITRRIPYKALVGLPMDENEKNEAYNEIYNYMDLCNEQVFLRKNGRVRVSTWSEWQDGMEINFKLPFFHEASNNIFKKLPQTFNGLSKVKSNNYKTDPRKW